MPNFTPRQKLFESLYRGKSAKHAPTLKQKQLNRSLNKPSAKPVGEAGKIKGSRSIQAQSKIRASNAATKAEFTRFGKQVNAAVGKGKASAAVNISKFGGGVKARTAPTLGALKTLAIRQGAKGLTLGRAIAGSKFLAGANSVPGLALIVGNYYVWKNNIRQLRNLYRPAPGVALWYPKRQQEILKAAEFGSSWFGGQDPNKTYVYKYEDAFIQNGKLAGWVVKHKELPQGIAPPFSGMRLLISYTDYGVYEHWSYGFSQGSGNPPPDGSTGRQYEPQVKDATGEWKNIANLVGRGHKVIGFIPSNGTTEANPGGGNLPPLENRSSSGGVSNKAIIPSTPSQVTSNPPTQLKPSTQPTPNKEKESSPIAPIPAVIPKLPQQTISDTVRFPDYIRGGLPIVTSNPTPSDTAKKPSGSVKKTYYPNTGESPDEAKARADKLRGRIDEIKKENGEEVAVVPTLPFLPIPGRVEKPGTTTKFKGNPSPSPSPSPTKVNPCRKGCGGAGGISAGAGIPNTAASEILDSALLLRIDRNTTRTVNTVTDANFGLAKIQKYAETAWKVTRADKVMAGVSMALTVHNAMMLSNNLLGTVSEATNMTLNALGIRDEEDTPIDLSASVNALMDRVLSGLLGDAKYAEITAKTAKANRIYQASINLLDTTYSLFDSARTVAELTGEYTGKIGNALRESGAVYEDAYEEFVERINPQNTAMRRLGSIRDKIEVAENAFDSVAQISGGILEVKETVGQIREEKTELRAEFDGFLNEQKEEKDTAKTQSQVTTDIFENDFDRAAEEN